MNRAFAFAVGVVVAGVAAKLLAGSPGSPSVIHQLDAVGSDQQLVPLVPRPEWSATLLGISSPSYNVVLFAGSRLVHKVVLDSQRIGNVSPGQVYLFDSRDPSDLSTPIAFVSYGGSLSAINPSQVELNVRVTKGLLVQGYGMCTVLHGE